MSALENVARVIAIARGRNGLTLAASDCAIARSVLEALREPTEEMVDAGDRCPGAGHAYDAKLIWQAMIDAATKDAPQ